MDFSHSLILKLNLQIIIFKITFKLTKIIIFHLIKTIIFHQIKTIILYKIKTIIFQLITIPNKNYNTIQNQNYNTIPNQNYNTIPNQNYNTIPNKNYNTIQNQNYNTIPNQNYNTIPNKNYNTIQNQNYNYFILNNYNIFNQNNNYPFILNNIYSSYSVNNRKIKSHSKNIIKYNSHNQNNTDLLYPNYINLSNVNNQNNFFHNKLFHNNLNNNNLNNNNTLKTNNNINYLNNNRSNTAFTKSGSTIMNKIGINKCVNSKNNVVIEDYIFYKNDSNKKIFNITKEKNFNKNCKKNIIIEKEKTNKNCEKNIIKKDNNNNNSIVPFFNENKQDIINNKQEIIIQEKKIEFKTWKLINKKRGRYKKDQKPEIKEGEKSIHSKYYFDNMVKKIKTIFFQYLFKILNQIIENNVDIEILKPMISKIIYNDEKKQPLDGGIYDKIFKSKNYLRTLSKKVVERNKTKELQDILNKKISDIITQNITRKSGKLPNDFNKQLVNMILKKYKNITEFNEILDLTFIQCINHFSGIERNEALNRMDTFENYYIEEQDADYKEKILNLLKNFETHIKNLKARAKKNKQKQEIV